MTAAGEHVINNKKVDPKKAKARHGKIFVGGLTTEISDDEIKAFFGQFGNVILLLLDKWHDFYIAVFLFFLSLYLLVL